MMKQIKQVTILILILLVINFVSAVELACDFNIDGDSGKFKMWFNKTLNDSQLDKLRMEMVSDDDIISCQVAENLSLVTKLDDCNFVISTLNSKIISDGEQVKKENVYRFFLIILIVVSITFVIIELYRRFK